MASIREQFRANSVALISIAIAIVALGYNTWRNETTETQRNVRHAAFRVLESLGENGQHTVAATQAEQDLTGAIRETRAAVLEVLSRLD